MTPELAAAHNWHPMAYSPQTGPRLFPRAGAVAGLCRVADGRGLKFEPGRIEQRLRPTATSRAARASCRPRPTQREGLPAGLGPGDARRRRAASPIRTPATAACWSPPATCWSRARSTRPSPIYRADNGAEAVGDAHRPGAGRGRDHLHDRRRAVHRHQRRLGRRRRAVSLDAAAARSASRRARLLVFKLGAKGVTLPPAAARHRHPAAAVRATDEAQVDQGPSCSSPRPAALPRRQRDRRGQGLAPHDAADPRASSTTSCSAASAPTRAWPSFTDC